MFHIFFSSLTRSTYLFSSLARCIIIIIIIIINFPASFLHQRKLMVSYWSLSDSKSLQISRTLLSILADFNNEVVWMVSIHSPIFKFSILFYKALETAPSVPITISITVTVMLHSFFKADYLSLFYLSLVFHSLIRCDFTKWLVLPIFFFFFGFLFVNYLLVWFSGQDEAICLYPRELCVSHSSGQILVCAFSSMAKFQSLAQFLVDHLPPSSRVLCCTCFPLVC